MSKFELYRLAQERSGVSYDESLIASALQPSVYDRIGGEKGFRQLSEVFYDCVFADSEARWFLNIFASSTREEAIENQYKFLVQTFGGPDLYRQSKGKYTRLVGRHANYNISSRAAERWVKHMKIAIDGHERLSCDSEASDALYKYFLFTAHYIVVASEYMRPDQLSGGNQMDAGRTW